jgi:hypothetical protein
MEYHWCIYVETEVAQSEVFLLKGSSEFWFALWSHWKVDENSITLERRGKWLILKKILTVLLELKEFGVLSVNKNYILL